MKLSAALWTQAFPDRAISVEMTTHRSIRFREGGKLRRGEGTCPSNDNLDCRECLGEANETCASPDIDEAVLIMNEVQHAHGGRHDPPRFN